MYVFVWSILDTSTWLSTRSFNDPIPQRSSPRLIGFTAWWILGDSSDTKGTVRCGSRAPHETKQFRFFTLLFFQAIPGWTISRWTTEPAHAGCDGDAKFLRSRHSGGTKPPWQLAQAKKTMCVLPWSIWDQFHSIPLSFKGGSTTWSDIQIILRCWSSILSVSTWHDVAWSFDDLIWR